MKNSKNYFGWDVEARDVFVNDGLGNQIILPTKKALCRTDNNEVLSIMGNRYEILTNEVLSTVGNVIAGTEDFDTVSTFQAKGGRRVCAQIKLTDNITIADDEVQEYVTLMNGHDGKGAFSIGFSNKVMSCANQYFAFKKLQKYSIWHTSDMMSQIDEVLTSVEEIKAQRELLNARFRKFADFKLLNVKDEAVKLTKVLSGIDLMIPEKRLHEEFQISKAAITKANTMLEVTMSEIDQKGNTAWGLFNGATYYSNHKITSNEPEGNLLYGRGAKINAEAMSYVSNLVGA